MSAPATRLSKLFLNSARDFPNRLSVREATLGDVDYKTAASIVADIVAHWRSAGLVAGDRVVLYADKNYPTIYVMMACLTSGVAWVSVSPLFSPAFMRDIYDRIGASWVYADESGIQNLGQTDLKTFGFGSAESYTLGLPAPTRDARIPYGDAMELLERENHAVAPGQLSFFVTTSGSTGRPKLISCEERPYAMGEHIKKCLLTYGCEEYSFLLGSSISHGFAVNMTQLAMDMSGTLCIPSQVDVATPLDEVRRFDCNVLTMTPRVLGSLYRQSVEKPDPAGGGSIFGKNARALLMAGGKPDASIIKKLVAQKIDPIDHYASSECAIMAVTQPGEWREGFAGRVLPGVTIEVAADGEFLVRTPFLISGYYGSPELSHDAFTETGLYRTGDLGEVLEDGWVRILGRKRDVFGSLEGSLIFPTRIEDLVERLPWVEQAFLVGSGEPYVSVLIVLRNPEVSSASEQGFLDPQTFASLYEERRRDLATMNADLERIERVGRVYLFSTPFDATVYTPVGGAKVRRDRAAFAKMFAPRIKELYEPCADNHPSVVAR